MAGAAAVGVALACLMASSLRNWLAIIAVCLCPALLLIAKDFYIVEQLTWRGLALVVLSVTLTNCLLYALIGIVYVLLRKRFEVVTAAQSAKQR